ncbi:hypothetical protein PINS_up015183 [Pythium insidiosum]|nr:hypothetical protein PINS_up015183 [Pythium insidiosum]
MPPTPQVDSSLAPDEAPVSIRVPVPAPEPGPGPGPGPDPDDDPDLAAPLLSAAPYQSHHPTPNDVPFTWFHRRRPPSSRASIMPSIPQLGKQGVIGLLCVINLFNYIDRGIIPGAPEKFQHFITKTLNVEVTKQSFYLGLLASGFIASYSICSMVFGHLAQRYRPFRMISFGMSIWVIAVVCCGLAHAMDSYYFLMFGRVLSGVGEASFQCNATPFINTHAPKRNRALWMGFYLASITVGTAMGYIYGSTIAATSLTWAGAFYIEGVIMVVLIPRVHVHGAGGARHGAVRLRHREHRLVAHRSRRRAAARGGASLGRAPERCCPRQDQGRWCPRCPRARSLLVGRSSSRTRRSSSSFSVTRRTRSRSRR